MNHITPIFVLAGNELTVKFIPASLESEFNHLFHQVRSTGAKDIQENELEEWLKDKL